MNIKYCTNCNNKFDFRYFDYVDKIFCKTCKYEIILVKRKEDITFSIETFDRYISINCSNIFENKIAYLTIGKKVKKIKGKQNINQYIDFFIKIRVLI